MTIELLKPLDIGHKILEVGKVVDVEDSTARALIAEGKAVETTHEQAAFKAQAKVAKTKPGNEDKTTETKADKR